MVQNVFIYPVIFNNKKDENMNAFRLLIALVGCIVLLPASYAEQGYQTPSPALATLVDAKLAPTSSLSSDGQLLALF